jgi:hypothetical protein
LAAKQRLRRAIMDENDGGAGRFVGAFATGDPSILSNRNVEGGEVDEKESQAYGCIAERIDLIRTRA